MTRNPGLGARRTHQPVDELHRHRWDRSVACSAADIAVTLRCRGNPKYASQAGLGTIPC
jgi:hypothetical protein